MNILFKRLDKHQAIPYDLLLLADPNKALVDEYLSRGVCLLAFIENEMVGEFVLINTRPQTVEIVNIAVKEEHQGRGIGKALVFKAIEEANTLNAKTIEIGTGNSGFKQMKLYQKCGFRIVGVDRDFFLRNYDVELFEEGIQIIDMVRLSREL